MNITNEDNIKGYIYSNQMSMFGNKEIIGYGVNDFYVKEIERDLANKTIIKNHYSKKVYNGTYINLGVFIKNEMLGVLQYGYAMNPASCESVVEGTEMNQYLELNRMWLDDKAIRNSESKAISYSIKYIKGKIKTIKWIQSFADERCGGLGIVYQACSFNFYGEHTSSFWELDGETFHNSIKTSEKAGKRGFRLLNDPKNKDRVTHHTLRQFRYIKFLDSRWVKKCNHKEKPYLKHYNND
tara:strand:+ start:23 stop:742 length:720 start_codon:yes stop_codon:yes gene_type:complete